MSKIMMRSGVGKAYIPINTFANAVNNRLNNGNFLPPRPTNIIPVPTFNKNLNVGNTKNTIYKQLMGQ